MFSEYKNNTSITIPDSVKAIGNWAFLNCKKLASVTISQNVSKLGDNIFDNCSGLKEIIVESSNKKYKSKDGVLFEKETSGLKLPVYPVRKKGETYKIPIK